MSTQPLVSCIMPTANRRRFVPQAIRYFLEQDYPEKELVILDDGEDNIGDLVPDDPRVCYVRETRRRLVGTKRNALCEMAQGKIIAHWDDDDWSSPQRLSLQVEALTRAGADACGIDRVLFLADDGRTAWEYVFPKGGAPWVYGASLCYTKDFWRRNRFPEIGVGEDTRFVWADRRARIVAMPDNNFLVARVHAANTSPKRVRDPAWRARSPETIRALMGPKDFAAYAAHLPAAYDSCYSTPVRSAKVANSTGTTASLGTSSTAPHNHGNVVGGSLRGRAKWFGGERMGSGADASSYERHEDRGPEWDGKPVNKELGVMNMLTVAKNNDLGLPEFRAFNYDRALPRMRQWELPFALFQSRLSDTMAVLDCTINPVDFGTRIARLFPHVFYRHWNPIANGTFHLPLGFPERSFDRVVCVNTIEHLLRPQREMLIKALAGKLKPGGRLIITCDYYFDSFWRDPHLLSSGVMRADRTEVFNGFNKVTPEECIRLCDANGLVQMGTDWEAPQEGDTTLLRQSAPYPHACIGGVFGKGDAGADQAKRKVLLALLTWNTRDVSLDSVRALLEEAAMLRRLGHEPYLCVCDNGSHDGTAEKLRKLDSEVSLPHRFILNPGNLGNSVARNQIINYMLECSADYLLFMDGDIEVVPFSSFAMLRYMEHQGSRLGCVGACSSGQTPYRERATLAFFNIGNVETTNLVAWTQYGMFRKEVFEDGIRFDEGGPFTGPGWGFEDNDLAFQMETKGYVNQRFFGMTYLHRDARSSVRIMKGLGIDAKSLYSKRKQYVIDKWASIAPINDGPLKYVRAVEMRL